MNTNKVSTKELCKLLRFCNSQLLQEECYNKQDDTQILYDSIMNRIDDMINKYERFYLVRVNNRNIARHILFYVLPDEHPVFGNPFIPNKVNDYNKKGFIFLKRFISINLRTRLFKKLFNESFDDYNKEFE